LQSFTTCSYKIRRLSTPQETVASLISFADIRHSMWQLIMVIPVVSVYMPTAC